MDQMTQEEPKSQKNAYTQLPKWQKFKKIKKTKVSIGTITGPISVKVASIRVNGRKLPLIKTIKEITNQVRNGEVSVLSSMKMDLYIKAVLKTDYSKAKEEKLRQMVTITKVSGRMAKSMEKVPIYLMMELCIMATGLKEKDTAKVSRVWITTKSSITVNSSKMKSLVMVNLSTRRVTTLETSSEENSKERVSIPSKTQPENTTRNMLETSKETR